MAPSQDLRNVGQNHGVRRSHELCQCGFGAAIRSDQRIDSCGNPSFIIAFADQRCAQRWKRGVAEQSQRKDHFAPHCPTGIEPHREQFVEGIRPAPDEYAHAEQSLRL